MRKKEKAPRWIVNLLRAADIPFQVAGGLAARACGATLPIADLDLYVPSARLTDIAELAAGHVTSGPAHVITG